MNENKRILLLALGIMAIVASDPPVAARPDWSYSACAVVRGLAVSAFDSLVRSTLPLSTDLPEGERTQEVLVAETPDLARTVSRAASSSAARSKRLEGVDRTVSDLQIVSTTTETVQTACKGSARTEEILRIEAVMQVRGAAVPSRG